MRVQTLHDFAWQNRTSLQPDAQTAVEQLAVESLRRGAQALSQLAGQPVRLKDVRVRRVRLSDLSEFVPDPEAETVGVFLIAEGDLRSQFLLLLSRSDATALADLMLARLPGVNEFVDATLDDLARSALGEVGNQLSALFLNSAVEATHRSGRPSPPVVLVDMAGAIVDLWLTASGKLPEYLLVVDATFSQPGREAEARFLVLPHSATLRAVAGGQANG